MLIRKPFMRIKVSEIGRSVVTAMYTAWLVSFGTKFVSISKT